MILPAPYYQDEATTLYCADCRDILPLLPKVDLVLTDPPYGLGNRMQGGTWGAASKYATLREWDKRPSNETIIALASISRSIIWGGNYFALPPSRCWLVWDKQNAVPTMADCELAWSNLDRPTKRFSWPVGTHNYGHPTEKPLELMTWCIKLAGESVDLILDPFAGSGTTLVAAKQLGRKAIGIEISEKYCEIAKKRLSQEYLL